MPRFAPALCLVAAGLVPVALAAIAKDAVPTLPGYGPPPTSWYSGYLDVPGGKHLHYIFVESMSNPVADPVSLWLNGGPGCSSLEGLFAELGQLLVDEQDPTKLTLNPYTWSNASNSLFIEAPACVGYSYADSLAGCAHNDSSQALDNYAALQVFFAGFPEFASNPFFVTGESYAGIYVPSLALAIYRGNEGGGKRINLKGIMVGNGCVGLSIGVCAFDSRNEVETNMPYFAGHGLISPSTWRAVQADCTNPDSPSAACNNDIDAAHNEVGNVNVYDIYGPCTYGPGAGHVDSQTGHRVHARAPVPMRNVGGPIECIDETIAVYIGSPAVAAALHVIPSLHWAVCGSNASFAYTRTEADERLDVYPVLIEQAKVQVLIYNGEADACVPWVDNAMWTESMGYSVASPWTAWQSQGQVAGYVVKYNTSGGLNFQFSTVKGAGHMVPQIRPAQAWTLFNAFISGTPL